MNDAPAEHKESGIFRFTIGLLALAGALGGFFALFYIEIPARNENALLLALGVVLGWAGSVVGSEYGATTTGRKVAESAVRSIERQSIAAQDEPVKTEVVNSAENPAHVTEEKKP